MDAIYWLKNLNKACGNLSALESLIETPATEYLEDMAISARKLTKMHVGKTIQLYAPLYLSNECINSCQYCGFNTSSNIKRKTLSVLEIEMEAKYLHDQGFRHVLLVSGENPKLINIEYLSEAVQILHKFIPSITLEVAPQSITNYQKLKRAGAEGIICYQETYNSSLYDILHKNGLKKDFYFRYNTLERAAQAGLKRLGAGFLLGLADWKEDCIKLAEHISYLLKHCWKSQITISLPRLCNSNASFKPLTHVSDKNFLQLILSLRIVFPQVGIILSTREKAFLRNKLIPLGITQMSAGSKTNPGGYLNQDTCKSSQFDLEDTRPPKEIAAMITKTGYEPIWKNWEYDL